MGKQEYQYQIRAHHGMCLVFFKGNGYSSGFTKHMGNVKHALEENPMIKVLADEDDICKECPNKDMSCVADGKAATYDREVLLRCHIQPGEVMPYSEFAKKVYDCILSIGTREEICGNCRWNELCHF